MILMLSGTHELLAALVPGRSITNQSGHGSGCHLGADFRQMQIHRLHVGVRRDHCGTDPTGRTNGTDK
jgi:hypothetical protein